MSREPQTIQIYEGYNFILTPEQVEAIRPAITDLEETNASGDMMCSMLAQVYELASGEWVVSCNLVPSIKATIIKDVLRSADMVSIKIENPK